MPLSFNPSSSFLPLGLLSQVSISTWTDTEASKWSSHNLFVFHTAARGTFTPTNKNTVSLSSLLRTKRLFLILFWVIHATDNQWKPWTLSQFKKKKTIHTTHYSLALLIRDFKYLSSVCFFTWYSTIYLIVCTLAPLHFLLFLMLGIASKFCLLITLNYLG